MQLVELIYELLDAHYETALLIEQPTCAIRWDAHLDYVRALQRQGREVLAAACVEQA
jgi:hypothetical protein